MTAKRLSGVKFEINRAAWLRRIGREGEGLATDKLIRLGLRELSS